MRMQSFHEQSRKALTIWCFCTGIRDPLTGSSSVLLSDLCCAQCRLCSHPRPSLQTHTKRDEDAGCHACGLFLYNSVKYCLYTVCFFNEGQLYIIHTPNNARETFVRDRFTFFFFRIRFCYDLFCTDLLRSFLRLTLYVDIILICPSHVMVTV